MRYKQHSAAAVEPGQHIRVQLKSHNAVPATFITTEGVVEATHIPKSNEPDIMTVAKFKGNVTSPIVSDANWQVWSLDLVLPDLPTAPGSAVKVYDTALLRNRLAVLMENAEGEHYWTWADGNCFWLSEDQLNRAEIVFDANPNLND